MSLNKENEDLNLVFNVWVQFDNGVGYLCNSRCVLVAEKLVIWF